MVTTHGHENLKIKATLKENKVKIGKNEVPEEFHATPKQNAHIYLHSISYKNTQ